MREEAKILVSTANLGRFDENHNPVHQTIKHDFFRFTDDNFPPIKGLTPRLQYRIPKLFSWQLLPGYDVYVWLDGSMSFQHHESLKWFLEQLGNNDIAVFKHPWRKNIREEVMHIEEKLKSGNKYILSRYQNGLHKENYLDILTDKGYVDDKLFASTVFIYRNTSYAQEAMKDWWYYQSRYYTCDQISLTYVLRKKGISIKEIQENLFKLPHISLTSKHK